MPTGTIADKPTHLGAYKLRLELRSNKTILVEGPTDKHILERLRLALQSADQRERRLGDRPIIEHVDQIDAIEAFSDLNVRGKAIFVANNINLPDKLKVLIDREWDDFSLDQAQEFQAAANFVTTEISCHTIGHSIENYFLQPEYASSYLASKHASVFDQDLMQLCVGASTDALKIAFCYSWALKSEELLNVSDRLIDCTHVIIDENGRHSLDVPKIQTALTQRNVNAEKVAAFSQHYHDTMRRIENNMISSEVCRWLSHGHRATEVFWSCMAAMAQQKGVNMEDAVQIARGDRELRYRACADLFAQSGGMQRSPLCELLEWAMNKK